MIYSVMDEGRWREGVPLAHQTFNPELPKCIVTHPLEAVRV